MTSPNRPADPAPSSPIIMMLHLMDKFLRRRDDAARSAGRRPPIPMHYTQNLPRPIKQMNAPKNHRQPSAKRFRFKAKVVIHKNGRYVKGRAFDISSTGLFVRADKRVFEEHERVRLYIRPEGMDKSYRAMATVVRFAPQGRFPGGYGLRFSTFSMRS